MYTMNYKLMAFIMTASLLGSGCAEEDALQQPAAPGTVTTGMPDSNSFTIARTPSVVEGLNFVGVTSTITVRVADRHEHPVPDDTVIRFLTNGGAIEPSCVTTDGKCTVTWNSQNPRPGGSNPGVPGVAVILAYTAGEESFNDLNDNDAFDAGETNDDISEPFMDHNQDAVHDADEEFVDFDNDNTFDAADGLYTGASCVGDNTVCNRSGLYVWGDTTVIMTGLASSFTFDPAAGAATVNVDQGLAITVTIVDANGNSLGADTTVAFSATDGTVAPASITVPSIGQSVFSTTYTAPDAAGTDTLTVTVTGPNSGTPVNATLAITIN